MPQTSLDPRLITLAGPIRRLVTTSVDDMSPITNEPPVEWRQRWQAFIDHELIEWGSDPSMIEDEGIDAPTRDTIFEAVRFAQAMMRAGQAPPTRVVPDANGGIVFEHEDSGVLDSIRISSDGIEYCRFQNARLVEHVVGPNENN